MTRGHRGSLLLRCAALSSASPCRFIPALNGCFFGNRLSNAEPTRIFNYGQLTFNNCSFISNTPDQAPSVWVVGSPQGVQYNNCLVQDFVTVKSNLSQILPLDYLSNYSNFQALPGSFSYGVNSDTQLQWLVGAYPVVDLGTGITLTVPATPNGTASFIATDSTIIQADDLILSSTPIYNPPGQNAIIFPPSRPLLGV